MQEKKDINTQQNWERKNYKYERIQSHRHTQIQGLKQNQNNKTLHTEILT